jgi:hypothetical protein
MNASIRLGTGNLNKYMPTSIIVDLITCEFKEVNILLKNCLKDEDYVDLIVVLNEPALVYLVGDYILIYLASDRLFASKRKY